MQWVKVGKIKVIKFHVQFAIHSCENHFFSIVTRFKTGNVFTERHTNTIGVDFSMKTLKIGNKKIKLQIWVRIEIFFCFIG